MNPSTLAMFSEDLRAASRVFGTAATIHIIGHLSQGGPQTRAQIVSGTGVSSGVVGQALNKLASLDAVTFFPAERALPARDRVYQLNTERLEDLLAVLHGYVIGSTSKSEIPAQE